MSAQGLSDSEESDECELVLKKYNKVRLSPLNSSRRIYELLFEVIQDDFASLINAKDLDIIDIHDHEKGDQDNLAVQPGFPGKPVQRVQSTQPSQFPATISE